MTVQVRFFGKHFAFSPFALGLTEIFIRDQTEKAPHFAPRVLEGESIAKFSPGGPYTCSECTTVIEFIEEASVLDYGARDAWKHNIVLGIPSSFMVSVLDVAKRIQCQSNFHRNMFEYMSAASPSVVDTFNGE